MAETTIQWTDYTFNPWVGCQRVSPGCEHCYAEAYDKRVGGVPKSQRDHYAALISLGRGLKPGEPLLRWGPNAPRVRTSAANWRKLLKWNLEAQDEQDGANVENGHPPARRRRVFCASLADVFEDRAELVPWREELFHEIWTTRALDWLLLTKRPENITRLWPKQMRSPDGTTLVPNWGPSAERWPNVWLGTTVEDRQRANERIPELLKVPAAVRFLSCEPLLESIDLTPWLLPDGRPTVDWVIVGGESGGGARPFDVAWARRLVKQCRAAGVGAVPFVKQLGARIIDRNDAGFEGCEPHEWPGALEYGGHIRVEHDLDGCRDDYQGAPVRVHLRDRHGGDPAEWPADLRVREFPEVRGA